MALEIISAGFGRTGTMSLKLALDQLGFGPCHHMDEVVQHGETQIPLWNAAAAGQPDFDAIYRNYRAAVDWPTAAFWRELRQAYPDAKFILSTRSVDSWCNSFSETILSVLEDRANWPEPARPWLEMVTKVVVQRSLGGKTKAQDLKAAFNAQEAAVKATIPPASLLVFDVREGWEPLCAYLGKPVPATPFPRTNSKQEFFDLMDSIMAES